MAHQNHNLPWNTLASNFEYAFRRRKFGYRTNLVPTVGAQQGKKIEHFARVFARLLTTYSSEQNRTNTPNQEEEPATAPHQRVVSKEAMAAMKKSYDYARGVGDNHWCTLCCPLHFYDSSRTINQESNCSCETYPDPAVLGHWLTVFRCARCCRRLEAGEVINLTKTMLLHDQMEPLLRIASHPEVWLDKFFVYPWEFNASGQHGWAEVLHAALYPYIALNLLYLKPDTWPSYREQQHQASNEQQQAPPPPDYRLTALYQRVLLRCTATRAGDVHPLPHRLFFGIARDALQNRLHEEVLVGQLPLEALYRKEVRGRRALGPSDVHAD